MFVVNGSSLMGSVSHRNATAKEAVETALVIKGRGFPTVHIASPDGQSWPQMKFPELLQAYRGRQPRLPKPQLLLDFV
jgi:hypothetical protein